jgi:RHH-type proline utilization regulon transcriptional repressor/proline dehydrogenase/delta 1-pyrroline-5-carboxylate dehydrogenase
MPFLESDLKVIINQIEEKGFALTLGVHTRIDSKISEISSLTSSGNLYVNRDIVGAVVESQPFGGNNLSGTGLKAGGPNYLIQFVNEKTTSINTVAIGGNPELLNKKSVT